LRQPGYGTGAYTVSSLTLSALYDSRDSTINPYRGFYGNLDYRISPTWLGSSKASSLLFGEFRAYVPLSDDSPRNVLAFWVLAQGVVTGDMPYLALPSTAWDATSVTGRGFIQGRFRGPAEVYGEVECGNRHGSTRFLDGPHPALQERNHFGVAALGSPGQPDEGASQPLPPPGHEQHPHLEEVHSLEDDGVLSTVLREGVLVTHGWSVQWQRGAS
jgi:hypothetical protein